MPDEQHEVEAKRVLSGDDGRDIHSAHDDHGHGYHHHPGHHHHEALVFFEDVNAMEVVDFRTAWSTILTAAWDEAARRLEEPRKPQDRLQTPEGKDLMPYLGLTLRELEERKIVHSLRFQIVGPTGGADADGR